MAVNVLTFMVEEKHYFGYYYNYNNNNYYYPCYLIYALYLQLYT